MADNNSKASTESQPANPQRLTAENSQKVKMPTIGKQCFFEMSMVSDARNKGRFLQISASNEEGFRGGWRNDNQFCFQVHRPSRSRTFREHSMGFARI